MISIRIRILWWNLSIVSFLNQYQELNSAYFHNNFYQCKKIKAILHHWEEDQKTQILRYNNNHLTMKIDLTFYFHQRKELLENFKLSFQKRKSYGEQ